MIIIKIKIKFQINCICKYINYYESVLNIMWTLNTQSIELITPFLCKNELLHSYLNHFWFRTPYLYKRIIKIKYIIVICNRSLFLYDYSIITESLIDTGKRFKYCISWIFAINHIVLFEFHISVWVLHFLFIYITNNIKIYGLT